MWVEIFLYTIGRYLEHLKESGVYDNTRIIIIADHGWPYKNKFLDEKYARYNPILMIKDFNSKDGLKLNFEFMTNADMPILAVSGIIDNPVNPYTGKSLYSSADKSLVKILTGFDGPAIESENKYSLRSYSTKMHTVHDDIYKPENWVLAD